MAPPGTSVLAATSQLPASTSRARPQARRKANPQDDAAYHGVLPPSAGTKRTAADKADGEPRVKRKRLEPAVPAASSSNASAMARKLNERGGDGERPSLVSTLLGSHGALDLALVHTPPCICTRDEHTR